MNLAAFSGVHSNYVKGNPLDMKSVPHCITCSGWSYFPLWINCLHVSHGIKGSEYQERLKGEDASQQADPLRACPLIPAAEEKPSEDN